MGPESNPGFNVIVEDVTNTGGVISGSPAGAYTPQWHRRKEDAIASAQRVVEASTHDGFVVPA